MASFALEIVNMRTAGTCQGYAMPRPVGASLTEPVPPQNRFPIAGRRKRVELSNPGAVIGSGSFDGGRPERQSLAVCIPPRESKEAPATRPATKRAQSQQNEHPFPRTAH